jgi:Tfp pilus assembly PilM family ATPase
VAVVKKKRDGFLFKKFGEVSLNRRTLKKGLIHHAENFKKALEEIKKEHRLHFVNLSVPAEQTYFLKLKMPLMESRTVFRSNLLFHLEEELSLPEEEILFTYNSLSSNGGYREVLVQAFRKSILNEYREAFREAGMNPVYFETEGESLRRAVSSNSSETMMIVDYGRTRTVISIIKKGLLYDLKVIDVSGKSFLKDELNNFLISRKEEPIKRIVLCGDSSGTRGLSQYLSSGLRVPVEEANIWQKLLPDQREAGHRDLSGALPAIGSALL